MDLNNKERFKLESYKIKNELLELKGDLMLILITLFIGSLYFFGFIILIILNSIKIEFNYFYSSILFIIILKLKTFIQPFYKIYLMRNNKDLRE